MTDLVVDVVLVVLERGEICRLYDGTRAHARVASDRTRLVGTHLSLSANASSDSCTNEEVISANNTTAATTTATMPPK